MADENEILDWGNDEDDHLDLPPAFSYPADDDDAVSLGDDEEPVYDDYLQDTVNRHSESMQNDLFVDRNTEETANQSFSTSQDAGDFSTRQSANPESPHGKGRRDRNTSPNVRQAPRLTHALPPKPQTTVSFIPSSRHSVVEATAMAAAVRDAKKAKANGAVPYTNSSKEVEVMSPWEIRTSRSSGDTFYFNTETEESTWNLSDVTRHRLRGEGESVSSRERTLTSPSVDRYQPPQPSRSVEKIAQSDLSFEDRHYRPGSNVRPTTTTTTVEPRRSHHPLTPPLTTSDPQHEVIYERARSPMLHEDRHSAPQGRDTRLPHNANAQRSGRNSWDTNADNLSHRERGRRASIDAPTRGPKRSFEPMNVIEVDNAHGAINAPSKQIHTEDRDQGRSRNNNLHNRGRAWEPAPRIGDARGPAAPNKTLTTSKARFPSPPLDKRDNKTFSDYAGERLPTSTPIVSPNDTVVSAKHRERHSRFDQRVTVAVPPEIPASIKKAIEEQEASLVPDEFLQPSVPENAHSAATTTGSLLSDSTSLVDQSSSVQPVSDQEDDYLRDSPSETVPGGQVASRRKPLPPQSARFRESASIKRPRVGGNEDTTPSRHQFSPPQSVRRGHERAVFPPPDSLRASEDQGNKVGPVLRRDNSYRDGYEGSRDDNSERRVQPPVNHALDPVIDVDRSESIPVSRVPSSRSAHEPTAGRQYADRSYIIDDSRLSDRNRRPHSLQRAASSYDSAPPRSSSPGNSRAGGVPPTALVPADLHRDSNPSGDRWRDELSGHPPAHSDRHLRDGRGRNVEPQHPSRTSSMPAKASGTNSIPIGSRNKPSGRAPSPSPASNNGTYYGNADARYYASVDPTPYRDGYNRSTYPPNPNNEAYRQYNRQEPVRQYTPPPRSRTPPPPPPPHPSEGPRTRDYPPITYDREPPQATQNRPWSGPPPVSRDVYHDNYVGRSEHHSISPAISREHSNSSRWTETYRPEPSRAAHPQFTNNFRPPHRSNREGDDAASLRVRIQERPHIPEGGSNNYVSRHEYSPARQDRPRDPPQHSLPPPDVQPRDVPPPRDAPPRDAPPRDAYNRYPNPRSQEVPRYGNRRPNVHEYMGGQDRPWTGRNTYIADASQSSRMHNGRNDLIDTTAVDRNSRDYNSHPLDGVLASGNLGNNPRRPVPVASQASSDLITKVDTMKVADRTPRDHNRGREREGHIRTANEVAVAGLPPRPTSPLQGAAPPSHAENVNHHPREQGQGRDRGDRYWDPERERRGREHDRGLRGRGRDPEREFIPKSVVERTMTSSLPPPPPSLPAPPHHISPKRGSASLLDRLSINDRHDSGMGAPSLRERVYVPSKRERDSETEYEGASIGRIGRGRGAPISGGPPSPSQNGDEIAGDEMDIDDENLTPDQMNKRRRKLGKPRRLRRIPGQPV